MRLLALDPNPTVTGFALFDGELVNCGELTGDMPRAIAHEITDSGATVVAVEGVYMGPNAGFALALAELLGAIKYICAQLGVECLVLSTKAIDSGCGLQYKKGGRKGATKAFAESVRGQEVESEHVADAICCGVAALSMIPTEEVSQ